jgi:RNA polymerase sigma factor (sigma-70 family)
MLSNSEILEYKKMLWGFLHSKYGYNDLIPDIIQETFYNFFANINNYDPSKPLSSYLFSIAEHKLLDILRRKEREQRHNIISENNILPPDKEYENKEIMNIIDQEIENLPKNYKEALIDRKNDLSFNEICKMRKIKLTTALHRFHFGKVKIRENLQDMKEYLN